MGNELFYREIPLEMRGKLDEEKREIDVSFSSETEEIVRWFGIEILSHEPGAIDLSVLKKIGSHLFNHNPDRIIGPINNIRLEDNKGRATLGYDPTDEGELAMIRTKNKSLKGVSVGYITLRMKRLDPGEIYQLGTKTIKGKEDPSIYIATKWQPREISSTPIPADTTVGLGRDLIRSLDGIEIINSNFTEEVIDMEEKDVIEIVRRIVPDLLKTGREETVKVVLEAIKEESRPKMRVSTEQYLDLMGKAGAVSPEAKIRIADMIGEGRTSEECITEILKLATGKPDATDTGDIGDGRTKTVPGTPSFDTIDDDVFFRTIANPVSFSIQ